jgi:hypothetical protein
MPQTQQDGAADEEAEEKQCIICFDAPRSIRFRPCHHSTMCDGCVLKLIARSENRKLVCLTCRTPVERLCREGIADADGAGSADVEATFDQSSTVDGLPVDAFITSLKSIPTLREDAEKADEAWNSTEVDLTEAVCEDDLDEADLKCLWSATDEP